MGGVAVTRRHMIVTDRLFERGLLLIARPAPSPKYKTTRTGASSGSLEVLGGLTKPYVIFIGRKFFRLMLCFVSIVSSAVTLPCPGQGHIEGPIPLKYLDFRRRNDRRRRP